MPFRACPRLSELPPPPSGATGWPWTVETEPSSAVEGERWPTITIVTPSYNQGAFIEATIRSVLLQGYPKLEYLVIDGNSTDGAREVIERYTPWLAGWVSEEDRGQADAINKGLARAGGEVIAWLNSDDRYLPGTLRSMARQVAEHRHAAAWIGACRSVNTAGAEIYVNSPRGLELPTLADWMGEAWFAQPASFYDREKTIRVGPLDDTLHSSFDVDFFLRLARAGRFVGTSQVWAEETIHPAAKTSAQPGRSFAELHLVQIRRGFEDVALRQMTREIDELTQRRREGIIPFVSRRVRTSLRYRLRRLLGLPHRT